MRRLLPVLLAAALPSQTLAVVGGTPDAAHGAVVLLANVAEGFSVCSAVVVGPRTLVTAAHCVTPSFTLPTVPPPVAASALRVYTAPITSAAAIPPAAAVPVAVALHPLWQGIYLHDVAVVSLAAPIPGVTPATLRASPLGFSDAGLALTLVGCGGLDDLNFLPLERRAVATTLTEFLDVTSLRVGAAGATACYGDAGAGGVTGAGQELAALVIKEQGGCGGPAVAYDAATLRSFVEANPPPAAPGGGCGGPAGGPALLGVLGALAWLRRRRAATAA